MGERALDDAGDLAADVDMGDRDTKRDAYEVMLGKGKWSSATDAGAVDR